MLLNFILLIYDISLICENHIEFCSCLTEYLHALAAQPHSQVLEAYYFIHHYKHINENIIKQTAAQDKAW